MRKFLETSKLQKTMMKKQYLKLIFEVEVRKEKRLLQCLHDVNMYHSNNKHTDIKA